MTDKEYHAQKKRVQKYIDRWFKTLGLGWFKVSMEWTREFCEHNKDTAASTYSSWQYKSATITWYLPKLLLAEDSDIEDTVVHEFCHILLSGLAQNAEDVDGDYARQVNEYTTELVARAVMWARTAGSEDKKPNKETK